MIKMLFCMFFFFSSRRRHTSSYGDWSSDVCSSDLGRPARPAALAGAEPRADRRDPSRAGRTRDGKPRIAGLAGASRHRPALPAWRRGRRAGARRGSDRPSGGQRQLRAARGPAGRGTAGVCAVRRGAWVALALLGGTLACAEWGGRGLGGPRLWIVPLVSVPVLTAGPCWSTTSPPCESWCARRPKGG